MRILITNDDGILAAGIEALYVAMANLGQVDVVAPDDSQSGVGHAISVRKPLLVQRVHVNNVFHGWAVDGRPADCVKLALLELLPERPDFVLSGINAGANAGINVRYSGTVAGAVEGSLFGIPSVAFSLELSDELDFPRAGKIARAVFDAIIAAHPPPGTCLTVNIPALDRGWPRGVRCCPQALRGWEEHFRKEPQGTDRSIYWLDGRLPLDGAPPDSDLTALGEGFVTVTPLRADLTDEARMATVASWSWPRAFGPS